MEAEEMTSPGGSARVSPSLPPEPGGPQPREGWKKASQSRSGPAQDLKSGNPSWPHRPAPPLPIISSTQTVPLDWKSVCIANASSNEGPSRMEFISPDIVNGKEVVSLSNDDIKEAEDRWKYTLMGYILGKRPYFLKLKNWITRTWKPKSAFEMFSRENGFFVFQFGSEDDRNFVLEKGPWFFEGRLLVLRNWDASLGLDRDLLSSVPVWIRLYGINLRAWTKRTINRMASLIGNPLLMDIQTTKQSRLDFARCLVELEAAKDPPLSITINLPDGSTYEQPVFYEWIPPRCSRCTSFGHGLVNCPKAVLANANGPLADDNSRAKSDLDAPQIIGNSIPPKVTVLSTVPATAVQTCSLEFAQASLKLDVAKDSNPEEGEINPFSSPVRRLESSNIKDGTVNSTAEMFYSTSPDLQLQNKFSLLRSEKGKATSPSLLSQIPEDNPSNIVSLKPATSVLDVEDSAAATSMLDVSPEQPFAVTVGGITMFSQERANNSMQGTESSSDDDGDVSSVHVPRKRSNFNLFLSKTREERFQELRSFGSQLGQKLAKSAISQGSIRDLPQVQEQQEDGAPFIEVIRKKSKQARGKGAGEKIRASPRIVKPNPKYIQ